MNNSNKAVLFGSREAAHEVYKALKLLDWEVVAVTDNDKIQWNQKFTEDIVIQSPEQVLYKDNFDQIIICSLSWYKEIKNDLVKNYSIEADKIVSCQQYYSDKVDDNLADKENVCNVGRGKAINWEKVQNYTDLIECMRKSEELNPLEYYFYKEDHRCLNKWLHYFEIYDRHFSRYRNKECVIMEIGIYKGGSLQMWKNYFGPKCKIIGVDIVKETKQLEEEQIEIKIGSQSDRNFWREIKKTIPKVDILIDDGGHCMDQQIITFEEMFDYIKEDGIYLCEDMHTSYQKEFGGKYLDPDTFVEYSKNFIDYINAWQNDHLKVNRLTKSMHSLHYYPSMLVIEKYPMHKPIELQIGNDQNEN